MTKATATAIGSIAILLWALLALFTVGTAPLPPLQVNAVAFAIGGALGLIWIAMNGEFSALRGISWKIYAFGTAGLFGYHFLYFSALRMAPPAEAGLIAYLWPLLIVLFSGLLPGENLRAMHLVGAALGFTGAAVLLGGGTGFEAEHLTGYALALCCAVVWASYSVISRRLSATPTASVTVFCLLTSALSFTAHLAFEETIWPETPLTWLALIGLGIGPVGIAFFVWDIGMKKGDVQLLGVASYAAPILSTLALILAGIAAPSWSLALASALIAGGAALAARASAKS
ncbi:MULTISPECIES: DMT family transporter [Halocynthiibacter]|uniref:EamA family transporter n=1 Tax=Halocynthiibacter halioticoli TaxID=2986804 RepID=A0AAE3IW48_9RHOB|nr:MULTISPECIES: EamA family transporter [Halocynthiibacter]MCV6823282.1 EamA family transporter [Halocynthiibacter halioticoli]MCW4056283.1 EamA family transporter [Halocynthiibacter sp. SDUM655004]